MYKEEFEPEKFAGNRGRDSFVENLLKTVNNKVTPQELEDVFKLMGEE